MLNFPEELKELFKKDNTSAETRKSLRLIFFDDKSDSLYPAENLYPEESLFPAEHGVPWLVIENDRIESESLGITETLSSSHDIEFGSCEVSKLEITVFDVVENLTGKEFMLVLKIGDYELEMGYYTVESYVRQSNRRKRKITAYDRMRKFNTDVSTWYNDLTFPMTLKTFRNSLCEYIGVTQSSARLILDDMEISKTVEPSKLSGLDVMKAICQINGCFGHFDKTGSFKYIQLQQTGLYPSEELFPEKSLYPSEFGSDGMDVEVISKYSQPMTYEDYLVNGISGLQIRQQEGDVGASVGDGDNAYIIEGNFLVYGKDANTLLNIAQSILPQISGRSYRPASLKTNFLPWVEIGDALRVITRNDIVETFCMKREVKGIQAMSDTFTSTGSETREESFGIESQIIQLEGKTAVIIKSVDEVSATVTDLKNYTEAQFKITADSITAEVTRAKGAEGELSSKITQTATEIRSEVTDKTNGLQSQITQTATEIRSEVTDKTNGLQSQITQQAGQIALKVNQGDVTNQLNSELKITGNSIALTTGHFTIDSTNMKLDASGNATFSGTVSGASISGSYVSGGSISGSKITGVSINIDDFFVCDSQEVQIGGFETSYAYGRDIFQSQDGQCGISASASKAGKLWIWAGYNSASDYDFMVNNAGSVYCRNGVHADDFYPTSYQHSVVYWIDWLYDAVQSLS